MFQFFRVKFFNDFLLPFDDIRVLFVEVLYSVFIFEKHLEKSSPPFKHFIESVLQSSLKTSLILLLSNACFLILILILCIPHIVRYEFLDLPLLFWAQLFFPNFVWTEHFHQPSHVLNQDIIACNHYFLLRIAIRLPLTWRSLRGCWDSISTISLLSPVFCWVTWTSQTCPEIFRIIISCLSRRIALIFLFTHSAPLWICPWSFATSLHWFHWWRVFVVASSFPEDILIGHLLLCILRWCRS